MQSTKLGQGQFGPGREAYFLRYNLLNHIGAVSTFRGRAERVGLACGAPLSLVNSFVPGTSFDAAKCPNDDMSPCGDPAVNGVPGPVLQYNSPELDSEPLRFN